MAAAYEELNDQHEPSPRERYNPDGCVATRRLLCAWSDRYQLIQELFGTAYPYYASSNMYALDFAIDPWPGESQDAGGGMAYYEKAVVTVRYILAPYKAADGNFMVEEMRGGWTTAATDYSKLYWSAGGANQLESAAETPHLMLPTMQYMRMFPKLTSVPFSVLTVVGKVNASSVYSPTFNVTFGAETLLAQAPTITAQTGFGGTPWYKVTQIFNINLNGWNKFYRTGVGFVPIYDKTGAVVKPYTPV